MPAGSTTADGRAERPVLIENGLCSRFRCTHSTCTACAAACPVPGAVRFVEQGAEITAACLACGACVSACPNGAVVAREGDGLLAARIRDRVHPDGVFRFGCDRAGPQADLIVSCIGRLTEGLVLEPIRCGAARVELLDPGCAGCGLHAAAAQGGVALAFAGALLEAAGSEAGRVARVPAPPDRAPARGSKPPRRALFETVAAQLSADDGPAAPASPPPAAPLREALLHHHDNPKRVHLLDVLSALADGRPGRATTMPADRAPSARIEVSAACVACDVCVGLCPVGALRQRDEDGRYVLDFHPALCTGCGVCAAACYHRAIRFGDTVDVSTLIERPATTVFRAERHRCPICGGGYVGAAADCCPLCQLSGNRRAVAVRRHFTRSTLDARP